MLYHFFFKCHLAHHMEVERNIYAFLKGSLSFHSYCGCPSSFCIFKVKAFEEHEAIIFVVVFVKQKGHCFLE